MSLDHLKIEALPPLREIIATHELAAKKALGQHFLLDLNVTRRIVGLAGDLTGHTVFEIGPGPGGLTRALLMSDATRVIALEKDARCIAALQSLVDASDGRLTLIEADALKADLVSMSDAPRAVVANLPYNVGTPMLVSWLKQIDDFTSLTLMFQEEVVDRLTATPRTKAYGRLSVLAQFCCHVEKAMVLPARAFTPPPKVDSAIVRLTPREDRPKDVSFKALEKVTAAAFGQRRKMLRSSLKALGGEALLNKANLTPTARAEELSIADFEKLARLV